VGGPISRPFPLSTAGLEDRFSLSEDIEIEGDGDIDGAALTALEARAVLGPGDAS